MHGRLGLLVGKKQIMSKEFDIARVESIALLLTEAIVLLEAVQPLPVIEY